MIERGTDRPHVLLITGTPGIGKTTVIRRVAEGVKAEGLRGFYTEEIRESGERRLSAGWFRQERAGHRAC
jgi:nucleoside-triphosphatase THEP1